MRKIRTVIVDDEPKIRRGIEKLVTANGDVWEVVGLFSDGEEAYEATIQQLESIDFLITDVQMPIMDGLTLIKRLNEQSLDFFTMIISGYDDFKYLQEAIREGAIDYILKPIDRNKFKLQLDEVKHKIIRKQEEMRVKIQLTHAKQIQFLSELTWNEETDISLTEWAFLFPQGRYKLVHIDIDQHFTKAREGSSEELRSWHFAVENMIKELLAGEIHRENIEYWLWKNRNLSYWLLLLDHDDQTSDSFHRITEQYLLKLKEKIQQYMKFTTSIAIGNDFEDLSLLPTMRDQLLSMIQFRIIEGGNKIFQLHTVNKFSQDKIAMMPASVYKYTEQIIDAFERKDERELTKILSLFFLELEKVNSPLQIQESVQYVCIRVLKYWMENDGFGEDIDLLLEANQMTKKAADLRQIREGIQDWILNILGKMKEIDDRQSDPVHQAKGWIKNHLGENITITKLADYVYMNPTYFCEYFKTQTGETVLNYVTKRRLQKAKELLQETNLKVYDIAESVGYNDTKYFSRLFKQWTNQSPTQYREKYIHHT